METIDNSYFKNTIQGIVNRFHKHPSKKRIVEYPDRIGCACPYCGDSQKNPNKKRGNFYFENLFFVCFNCGQKASYSKFCKDFSVNIDPDTKIKIYDYLDNHINYNDYEESFLDSKFDSLIDLDELTETLNKGETLSPIIDFKPVVKNGYIYNYLIERGITPSLHKNIYQAKFQKGPEWFEPVIVLLNRKENKVLGIQVRNLKSGYKRMFKIYNFEQLNEWVHPERDVDMAEMVMYNKMSYFFNILNINFDSTITIFEGYIDSLFYPNSIGVVGTNTDTSFLENNNLDLQFFYDNDQAGYNKANDKLKAGFPIFLWKKMFEDIVAKKNTKDPYSLMHRISKVKDLNQLANIIMNPYKELRLPEYFSKDIYDIRYLPKKKSLYNSNRSFKK
jgi:hypothetical protein